MSRGELEVHMRHRKHGGPVMSPADLKRAIRRHPDGAKILAAVEKALAEGWTIRERFEFPDAETRECCALGALRLSSPSYLVAAMLVLGWDDAPAYSFARGFDGDMFLSTCGRRAQWQLGRLFRRLLVVEETRS